MFALQLVDVLGFGAILAVCAGMLWAASHIEPHWVSKDLTRFMASGQELDQFSTPVGRRVEVRVNVDAESGTIEMSRRSMVRSKRGTWRIRGKLPDPPKGKVVFLLDTLDDNATVRQMLLRIPENSRIRPTLERILAGDAPAT